MSKRYRLLKDLPQCEAGTIFEKYSEDAIDYVALGVTQWDSGKCKHIEVFLLDCHIEDNKEWFTEILPEHKCPHCGAMTSQLNSECYKAPEQSKEFVWDDKLVLEFASHPNLKYMTDSNVLDICLQEFKRSKQQAPSKSESHIPKEEKPEETYSVRLTVGDFMELTRMIKKSKQGLPIKETVDEIYKRRMEIEEATSKINHPLPDNKEEKGIEERATAFWYNRVYFTQQELDKAREESFNAARDMNVKWRPEDHCYKYRTFWEYLQSIKVK